MKLLLAVLIAHVFADVNIAFKVASIEFQDCVAENYQIHNKKLIPTFTECSEKIKNKFPGIEIVTQVNSVRDTINYDFWPIYKKGNEIQKGPVWTNLLNRKEDDTCEDCIKHSSSYAQLKNTAARVLEKIKTCEGMPEGVCNTPCKPGFVQTYSNTTENKKSYTCKSCDAYYNKNSAVYRQNLFLNRKPQQLTRNEGQLYCHDELMCNPNEEYSPKYERCFSLCNIGQEKYFVGEKGQVYSDCKRQSDYCEKWMEFAHYMVDFTEPVASAQLKAYGCNINYRQRYEDKLKIELKQCKVDKLPSSLAWTGIPVLDDQIMDECDLVNKMGLQRNEIRKALGVGPFDSYPNFISPPILRQEVEEIQLPANKN